MKPLPKAVLDRIGAPAPGLQSLTKPPFMLEGIDPSMPVLVAYGAGVDSTAMLIGMAMIGWRPDLILFADTGSEHPRTYAYIPIFDDWLASVGFRRITIVKNASPKAGDKSLYDECHRKSVLPSLAYGGHSCSLKWKIGPQDRYCRSYYGWTKRKRSEPAPELEDGLIPGRWNHGPWILKLIGYDAGPADARRRANAKGKWPPGTKYRYALAEWGWDRDACIKIIKAAGLPVPGKSACFMCPASKKFEVDQLAEEEPGLARKAMELETRAHQRGLKTVKGLGRNWSWSTYLEEKLGPRDDTDAPPCSMGRTCG